MLGGMTDTRAPRIAIFDSGIGGLTVAAAIHASLPGASLRYLGDTARLPYGSKSAETVTRYALQASRALLADDGADALVVACNTASSCALPALEAEFDLPVLGVIAPGARRAVASAARGSLVGVIGTERTIASGAYGHAIAAIAPGLEVSACATPLLVALAEEGFFAGPLVDAALDAYLDPWLGGAAARKLGALVLGCTHFPVLAPAIAAWLARRGMPNVALVDSALAIAEELAMRFPTAGKGQGAVELLATDGLERFRRVGSRFFPLDNARLQLVDL